MRRGPFANGSLTRNRRITRIPIVERAMADILYVAAGLLLLAAMGLYASALRRL